MYIEEGLCDTHLHLHATFDAINSSVTIYIKSLLWNRHSIFLGFFHCLYGFLFCLLFV